MPLIDLREHFGIWERCGNSRFFQKNPENPWELAYLNPLDGTLVSARRTSMLDQEPRYDLVVRDAKKVGDKAVAETFSPDTPWVKRVVKAFFYHKALGWALDAIKRYGGQKPEPGDRDMRNFLNFYQKGGKRYQEEGGSPEGDKPMLEETLEGVLRTISSLEGAIADYGRDLSREDLESALSDLGILEC